MKPKPPETDARRRPPATSELLILPDGQVLAHNLTPTFVRLLAELDLHCHTVISRAPRPPALDAAAPGQTSCIAHPDSRIASPASPLTLP